MESGRLMSAMEMAQQIVTSAENTDDVITQTSEPLIAICTEQTADVSSRMIMVNHETPEPLGGRNFRVADGASAILAFQQYIVLFWCQAELFTDVALPDRQGSLRREWWAPPRSACFVVGAIALWILSPSLAFAFVESLRVGGTIAALFLDGSFAQGF